MPLSLHAISARRTRPLPGRLGRTLFALALSALLSSTLHCQAQGVGFSDGGGTTTTPTGTSTVQTNPTVMAGLTTQPANQSTAAGCAATFTVTTDDGSTSFQWQISSDNGTIWTDLTDDTTISGSNTSTLTLSNATLAMNGQQFRVIDTAIPVTSTSANLTVLPIVIDVPPGNQTASAGSTVTFSSHVLSASKPSYQWLKNGAPIPKATQPTLTLTNVQSKDAASYTVKVANKLGRATSPAAILTVTKAAPVILTPPALATVKSGTKATFTVTARGTTPLFYRWNKNGTPLTNNRATTGAFTSTLTLSKTTSASQGTYQVTITNSAGQTTSTPVPLTIN